MRDSEDVQHTRAHHITVDTAPDEDDEEGPTDSLTAAVAIKLAKERAAQVALQDANAALQRHVQRLQDQLAAQQAQHAEREGQLLACLSQTTKAHMEAMQRLGKGGHVPLDAAVRPLYVMLGDLLANSLACCAQRLGERGGGRAVAYAFAWPVDLIVFPLRF